MTVSFFIVNLINSIAMLYASAKILNSKINYKDYKTYISLIILTSYTYFMYYFTHNFYRMILLVQVYIICNFIIHKKNDKTLAEITIVSLVNWILLFFCEIIGGILLYGFLNLVNVDLATNVFANTFISLFIIAIFVVIISMKKIVKFLSKNIIKINNFRIKNLILLVLYVSVLFSMLLYLVYFDFSREIKMYILLIILVEYTTVLYTLFSENKKSKAMQNKLDTMLKVTTEYEKILEESRVTNHENKNQLIVIKGMIDSDNQEAIKYIQKLIKNTPQDDNEMLLKVSSIPLGGLRGLIYYKLLAMKEHNISCCVNVSKKINKNIFQNMDTDLLQSFCKVIGVFLDNAIEAVEASSSKIVNIELYVEESYFVASISNKYDKPIQFEDLGKSKFTTKGESHGYGLQLVEKLVKENTKLIHEKEVVSDLFIQKIKVNLEK